MTGKLPDSSSQATIRSPLPFSAILGSWASAPAPVRATGAPQTPATERVLTASALWWDGGTGSSNSNAVPSPASSMVSAVTPTGPPGIDVSAAGGDSQAAASAPAANDELSAPAARREGRT